MPLFIAFSSPLLLRDLHDGRLSSGSPFKLVSFIVLCPYLCQLEYFRRLLRIEDGALRCLIFCMTLLHRNFPIPHDKAEVFEVTYYPFILTSCVAW